MNTPDGRKVNRAGKGDVMDELLTMLVQSGHLTGPDSGTRALPATWQARLREATNCGQEARLARRTAVAGTKTFDEFLTALLQHTNQGLEEICTQAQLDAKTVKVLESGGLKPWHCSVQAIVQLVDALYGSLNDVINRIQNTPVGLTNQLLRQQGPLVARSHGLSTKERRVVLDQGARRMAEIKEERRKQEFLEELCRSL